jgi:hypothetical protein
MENQPAQGRPAWDGSGAASTTAAGQLRRSIFFFSSSSFSSSFSFSFSFSSSSFCPQGLRKKKSPNLEGKIIFFLHCFNLVWILRRKKIFFGTFLSATLKKKYHRKREKESERERVRKRVREEREKGSNKNPLWLTAEMPRGVYTFPPTTNFQNCFEREKEIFALKEKGGEGERERERERKRRSD